ncbi:MAG: hypothetical protein EPO42_02345 [Gallionellaceae bacterium]|nr:MAG: hypothetical protein EPO42_02345 [Gallionellaceae bacterium]
MQLSIFSKSIPVLLAGLILSGCATQSVLSPPKADKFDFDQLSKNVDVEAKQDLAVKIEGNGVKPGSKVVIGAFEVRFRRDLDAVASMDDGQSIGHVVSENRLELNENLYQKVTEDLYQRFLADLKKRYTVVPSSELKLATTFAPVKAIIINPSLEETAGMQKLKDVYRTPRTVANATAQPAKLLVWGDKDEPSRTAFANCADSGDELYDPTRVGNTGRSVSSGFRGLFGDGYSKSNLEYTIFYPKEVPNLEIVSPEVLGMTYRFEIPSTPLCVDGARPRIPPAIALVAAAKLDAKIVSVVFEVQLMKFAAMRGTCGEGFSSGACIMIKESPMVRTQLHSLMIASNDSSAGMFSWAKDAVFVTGKSRGQQKRNWILHAMLDNDNTQYGYNWAEIDDGSVKMAGGDTVTVDPNKFPTAFKKSTDAHLQMLMHVLDHQADFK